MSDLNTILARAPDVDWVLVGSHFLHMAAAYLLALPVGWDRESHARSAGLRTFPLVAIGSCGYMLLAMDVFSGEQAHARVLYGLITGIGFIGGGAILKNGKGIDGTATAASIWITGAIGAAIAWQRYEIAIVLAVITFITFRVIKPLAPIKKSDA